MNNNLHWHWKCNNKIFYNKIDAMKENVSSNQPIRFIPRHGIVNQDLSTSPDISWQDLLKQRVISLREKHKYIKVWFSGGVDSTRMLLAFLDNNVYIDEIVCVKSGIPDADYEIDDIALPFLEKYKEQLKKTKIKIVTPTIQDYKQIFQNPNWVEDFTQLETWHFRLNNYFECLEYKNYDCANIIGREKPLLVYKDSEWWATWLDLRMNPSKFDEHTRINFYDDDLDIVRYQSHSLKNHIVDNFEQKDYNTICFYQSSHQKHLNFGCGRIDKVEKDFILKSFSEEEKFTDYKNKRIYFTNAKDRMAIKAMLKEDDQIVLNWKNSIDDYAKNNNIKNWFNNNTTELGTRGIFSDFYSLNRHKVKTIDQLFPNGFKLT